MPRWFAFTTALALALGAPSFHVSAQDVGAYLGNLTWPDAERRIQEAPIVVIPFGGGAKEHGPHLPMNADAAVMEYLCQQAVDSVDVLVAPPIYHGWFPAFRAFPGTEIADPQVFGDYVFEVARSLARQGARRLVFLNTGISKATGLPISIAARELRVQFGIPVLVLSWDDLETSDVDALADQRAGGHADELETSIHLYLQPDLVHMERAVTDYGTDSGLDYPGYEPGLFARDPADPEYSTTGLFGDPTLATPEKGEAVLGILTRQWLLALREFSRTPEAQR
ncbi:MAG: creatininase family protein [Gemmatimonadota bacterium]|nr:creatininase family protein [Gemmatimonadota bacterium]